MIKELCRPIVHSNYSIQQWKVILDPNPLLEQQNCDLLSTPPRPPILSPQEDEEDEEGHDRNAQVCA